MDVSALVRWLVPASLLVTDAAIAVGCLAAAIWIRDTVLPALHLTREFHAVRDYATLWPALVALVAMRAVVGLYPGYGRTAPEELRLQTVATALLAVFIFTGAALFRFSGTYSRIVLGLSAALGVLALPLGRALVKESLSRLPFYGRKVVVMGRGGRVEALQQVLTRDKALGLRPVAHAHGSGERAEVCLLIPDGLTAPLPDVLDELARRFPRVLLAPDLLDVASAWVTARDIGGHLTLELRNNLQVPVNRWSKRVLDLMLTATIVVLTLPVSLLVALSVMVDSGFPLFVRQRRVGRGGREFWVYKFRTMRRDAERELERLLASDPRAREEWEGSRKLKHDPRVTRIGRLLRKASLDELPQLANILRGEMSLVGPRPITSDEVALYGDRANLYLSMRPGLTGLMQVSGRNDIDYDVRVRLDAYYVRNWSVWLDFVVLARTVTAVVQGTGAY